MIPVSLLGLATALPPHVLRQDEIAALSRGMFADTFAHYPQLNDVFDNAGIDQRYSARPLAWFEQEIDWHARTAAYLDGACALFVAAATLALRRAGCAASEVDSVVLVSSTGIATPTIEARAGPSLGLRPDVARVPVFGLGCAGGVTGLALAARLARAEPGKIVLLVVIELCTLAFRRDRGSKADIIAAALFGDGAAALVLCADPHRKGLATLGAAAEHQWPNTLDIMGWSVDPLGFGVILSRALPSFVGKRLAAPARRFLGDLDTDKVQFIIHPGGSKVLAAVEAALDLPDGQLARERAVLRDHGNMSAPTVLFVLERALAEGVTGTAVLAAMGPGFTASFLALDLHEAAAPQRRNSQSSMALEHA